MKNKYAIKWEKITRDRYSKLFHKYDKKEKLSVYATFTNCAPSRLSQEPQILTTWGNSKKELIKQHVRNYERADEYTEYFEAIEWEKK